MFGRAIWDKLTEYIFENFEIAPVLLTISNFPKITRVIYPQNRSNQACYYWLIPPKQQNFVLKLMPVLNTRHRGGSRAAAISKMGRFMIIVNSLKPLTIITNCSILNVAAALDPPLRQL